MYRKLIDKVIASNDLDKLKQIAELEIDTIDILKEYSKKDYKSIETDLYEIVEGKVITKEMAIDWVESMKPKAKWTYDEIESLKKSYDIDMPTTVIYVIMNMLYILICKIVLVMELLKIVYKDILKVQKIGTMMLI